MDNVELFEEIIEQLKEDIQRLQDDLDHVEPAERRELQNLIQDAKDLLEELSEMLEN